MIAGFGTLSVAHARELASGLPLARSLAGFIALFWLIRLLVQLFVFDVKTIVTNRVHLLGNHALTAIFVTLVAIYGLAALRPL